MDWPTNYVYVPEWLLIALAGLAFIGFEFIVMRTVRQLDRWTRPRIQKASARILRLQDLRADESRPSIGKEA